MTMRKIVLDRGPDDRPNDEQLMTLRRLWLEDMCSYSSLEHMRLAAHMRADGVYVVPLDYRHAFINRGGYEI